MPSAGEPSKNESGEQPSNLSINVGEEVKVSTELLITGNGEESEFSGMRQEGPNFSGATDKTPEGKISQAVRGAVPKNKDGELEAAKIFIQYLNQNGNNFDEPQSFNKDDDDIDVIAQDKEIPQKIIKMQVTRPNPNKIPFMENWGKAKQNEYRESMNIEELAEDLMTRIKHKISRNLSKDVFLLLDATKLNWYAMPAVVQSFKKKYGNEVNQMGCNQIWLIGPAVKFCYGLNEGM